MLTERGRHIIGLIILGCSTLFTVALVFFPSGWVINRINVQIWWLLVQNTPVKATVTPEDLAQIWNVLMFVPLGVSLTLILPRWWWMLVLCCLSISIETVQYFFFPARHADIMDVVMNTTGGVVGVAIALLYARRCENRSDQSIDSSHA